MPDDPRKPRASSHWGDDRRASRRTPHGVPVEIDPETTPPPLEPPEPDAEAYDTIPPTIRGELDRLRESVRGNAHAIGRVWDERGNGERIDRLEIKLDALTGDVGRVIALIEGFIHPVVKAVQGELHGMSTAQTANQARAAVFWEHEWPAALKSLDGLDTRLDRIERQQEDHARDLRSFGAQVQAAGAIGSALDTRVTALERAASVERTERDKEQAVVVAMKRRDKWWLGLLVTAGGAIGAVAHSVIDWIRK